MTYRRLRMAKLRMLAAVTLGTLAATPALAAGRGDGRDWNRGGDTLTGAVGLHYGAVGGTGLSFRMPLQWYLYAQAAGGIWHSGDDQRHNLGLQLHYLLRQDSHLRLFTGVGAGFYYHRQRVGEPALDVFEAKTDWNYGAAFIAVLFNKVLQRPISGWEQKIDDLFKDMIERDGERIKQTFSRAFAAGRGASWLTSALRKDFALNAQTAHIILHAAVQHSRSVIVDFAAATVGAKVRWVSVLDGKTTAICRARSGKIYDAGSGPRPPAHARCRSIVVPYFEGKGDAEEPTYSDWLKKQTPERVRQILGKTKGDMFLHGELSLEDMVTAKGRELTLKELAAKRP